MQVVKAFTLVKSIGIASSASLLPRDEAWTIVVVIQRTFRWLLRILIAIRIIGTIITVRIVNEAFLLEEVSAALLVSLSNASTSIVLVVSFKRVVLDVDLVTIRASSVDSLDVVSYHTDKPDQLASFDLLRVEVV